MPDSRDKSGDDGRRAAHIRSFVRRAGRTTPAQRRALETLWPKYGVDYSPSPLDLDALFGRRAPRIMEIGYGNGDVLAAMAAASPGHDFIGVEVHEPGIGRCLMQLERAGCENVRLIRHDAVEVLTRQVPDGALDGVNLFYPDPWPKKRHHKRRIVNDRFAALLARKLSHGGRFHVATDWAEYAEHIDRVIRSSGFFTALRNAAERPKTRFETRGERLGHATWEAVYERA